MSAPRHGQVKRIVTDTNATQWMNDTSSPRKRLATVPHTITHESQCGPFIGLTLDLRCSSLISASFWTSGPFFFVQCRGTRVATAIFSS